mgnify:CR=1 FL=1
MMRFSTTILNSVLAALACAAVGLAPACRADSINSYGIFADHLMFFSGGVNTFEDPGVVMGSNGDMYLSGGNFGSLRGGGSLYSYSSGPRIQGDVVFGDNVMMGTFSRMTGNVHAGGDVFMRTELTGSVTAGGTVVLSDDVTGDVTAGGAATITRLVGGSLRAGGGATLSSTVGGDLIYGPGKSLHLLPGAFVGGTIDMAPVNASPQPYHPVALPTPHSFSSGGADLFLNSSEDAMLAPGSYGTLTMVGGNDIDLTAGDYFFDKITMSGNTVNFNFDTSGGPISIFVKGSVRLNYPNMAINGVGYNDVDPADVGQVYWEVHDAFTADGAEMLGTVYTPYGDLTLNRGSRATGRLIAGHDFLSDGLTFVAGSASPAVLVPEPSSLVLAAAAAAALGVIVSRRRTFRAKRLSCELE